jgi:hypothetical protein
VFFDATGELVAVIERPVAEIRGILLKRHTSNWLGIAGSLLLSPENGDMPTSCTGVSSYCEMEARGKHFV